MFDGGRKMEKQKFKSIIMIITYAIILFFAVQNIGKVGMLIKWIANVTLPFLIGACLAFVLSVPMKSIENKLLNKVKAKWFKKIKRAVAIVLTLILFFGIVALILFMLIPELINTVELVIESAKNFIYKLQDLIAKYELDLPMVQKWLEELELDWGGYIAGIFDFAGNGIGNLFTGTFVIISSVVSGIFNIFIGFVFAIYILAKKETLASQFKKLFYAMLPEKLADNVVKIAKMSHQTFANFITGQCTEAIVLGSMFVVTLLILKYPYALLIGVIIAVTALVPIFGAIVGCIIAMFLIFMVDPVKAIWFFVIFQVLQQIEGNLIYPHVVGNSVGLPSIWVLVAVTLGGNLFGVVGMLVFIPLSSVLYALLREKVNNRLKERKIKKEKYEIKK